ncbi:MAG: hypothetical protein H0U86_02785 [Chloroflexi bacterium]|nr:hypothetical protein [Chloroflexota bacterium]
MRAQAQGADATASSPDGADATPASSAGGDAGRTGDGGGAGRVDPCAFVMPQEVEDAVGVAVAEATADETGGCQYLTAEGDLVVLTSYCVTGGAALEGDAGDAEESRRDRRPRDLAVQHSVVAKGDALFQSFADDRGPDDGDDQAAAEELARLAVDRLP